MPIKIRKSDDGCVLISDPYIAATVLTLEFTDLAGGIPDPENPKKKYIKIKIEPNNEENFKKVEECINNWFMGKASGSYPKFAEKLKYIRYMVFNRK